MYKAQQIIEEGGNVIMIAYTKSLNRYMQQGKPSRYGDKHFFYHWQWIDAGKPSADYFIVDEIQDFQKKRLKSLFLLQRNVSFSLVTRLSLFMRE